MKRLARWRVKLSLRLGGYLGRLFVGSVLANDQQQGRAAIAALGDLPSHLLSPCKDSWLAEGSEKLNYLKKYCRG